MNLSFYIINSDPIAAELLCNYVEKTEGLKLLKIESDVSSHHLEQDYFFIQSDLKGNLIKIVSEDILYLESSLNYLKIHTQDRYYVTYLTMKEMEERLPARKFMRVHKSFLVNLSKISSVEGNMINLCNRKSIMIGRNYRREYFEKIGPMVLRSKRR